MNDKSLLIAKILCTILLLGVWGVYVTFFFTGSIFLSNIAINLTLYSIIPIIGMYKPLLWVGGYRVNPKILYSIWIIGFLLSFVLVNTVKDVWGGGILIMYLLVIITPWIFPEELKDLFQNKKESSIFRDLIWLFVVYFVVRASLEPIDRIFELSSIAPAFVGFLVGGIMRYFYLKHKKSK